MEVAAMALAQPNVRHLKSDILSLFLSTLSHIFIISPQTGDPMIPSTSKYSLGNQILKEK